ncbi:iron-containing alcohol dehydrogenase family protein [Leptospira idonii]|uniref:Iron-containing alcohol dehydrogenase n=1 Tax=Leptospira idonii TaxID=1193500 RepID=A0A4R9LVH7_9LEPT|nr:iron-containing alcohol dehydrogenase family protein [Leptospira idonii]TGN18244.1 iron-containing alcohol dehydrogenase [Leptospira idonii]
MVEIPNSKNVLRYAFGKGALQSLEKILKPKRAEKGAGVVYFLDIYFQDKNLASSLPVEKGDLLFYYDSTHEPKTDYIDGLRDQILGSIGEPCAIVGLGGGCTLDVAKAVSNLIPNQGKSEDYQGWDLLSKPGIFKVGIPTISGTGAEASRTCVLMNLKKNLKLGMNSEFTIYDQLILDPDLTASVPRDQYFYTGMDTYIHCIESLNGSFRHPVGDAFSREALELCREVFLSDDMMSDQNRQKLMVASYLGGCAIANSYVGVVHPFSAGLSVVLGTHHCVSNCIVMNQMEEFYPKETKEFHFMLDKQKINLPKGICSTLNEDEMERLYLSTVIHEKPLTNALGSDFKNILTREKTKLIFSSF